MAQRNMTDIIESYLKEFLKTQSQVEIKRSDIAEHFDCVPSQINYVINTRFTQEHGYLVESKRGGGGYIRILKVQMVSEVDQINQMIALIDEKIDQRSAFNIISTLVEEKIVTQREAALMLTMIDKTVLQSCGENEHNIRAKLLKAMLQTLRYQ